MKVYMSSRRTVMSGEVVTFATSFEPWDSAFGVAYRAKGPFEISASRDAVMVHRACCQDPEEMEALVEACNGAAAAYKRLEPTWRGGAPSMFPEQPTEVSR